MWSSRWLRSALGIALALALCWVPASLKAQDLPSESEPSVSVPSLPVTPRASGVMESGDGTVACPPPAAAPIVGGPLAVPFSDLPFVPFMLGDFTGPLANPMTDIKVGEGESPIPLDRVFYRFNFYSNLNPWRYESVSTPYKRVNLFTNVFGFEKKFGDWFSFGFRLPIDSVEALSRGTFYVRSPIPGQPPVARPAPPDYRSTIFGNITAIFKVRLVEDVNAGYLVSTGLAMSFPTATNISINPGPSTAATFQPFLGYLWTRDRFFVQGFTSMTLPLVAVQSLILFQDLGVGLWAYRNDSQTSFLTGIAPTFEMHLNVPLQGNDRVAPVFQRAGYFPFHTQFNLTFGGTFEFFRARPWALASWCRRSARRHSTMSSSPSSTCGSESHLPIPSDDSCFISARAFRLGEPVADGEGEAGKDVAAVELLVFRQDDRVLGTGIDSHGAAFRIDVPDEAHTGAKVLVELPRHLRLGVSLAEHLDHEVGATPGISPRSRFDFGKRFQEMKATSGMRTRPGKRRTIPSGPTKVPRSCCRR